MGNEPGIRPVSLGKKEEAIFLGREFSQQNVIGPETAIKIDQEIKRIIITNYGRAKELLESNRHLLEKIAEALLEYETLDTEQIKRICDGLPVKDAVELAEEPKVEPAKVKGRPVPVPQS